MTTSRRDDGRANALLRVVVWVLAAVYLGRIYYDNTLRDLRQLTVLQVVVRGDAENLAMDPVSAREYSLRRPRVGPRPQVLPGEPGRLPPHEHAAHSGTPSEELAAFHSYGLARSRISFLFTRYTLILQGVLECAARLL